MLATATFSMLNNDAATRTPLAIDGGRRPAGVCRYQRVEREAPAYEAVRFEVFAGGCVATRITAPRQHQAEVTAGSAAILGFTTREQLGRALEERSDGRLQLDPETR